MLGKRKESDNSMAIHDEQPSSKKIYGQNTYANTENFSKYRISTATMDVLRKKGIHYLFPIQEATFDPIFDGKDVIGRDLTGSGKTLGFALPLIEKLRSKKAFTKKYPQLLIVVPTRELAIQVIQ